MKKEFVICFEVEGIAGKTIHPISNKAYKSEAEAVIDVEKLLSITEAEKNLILYVLPRYVKIY